MKNKEFAVYRFFGLDFTSRKVYRGMLALKQSALDAVGKEMKAMEEDCARKLTEATGKLQAAENALKAAIDDYNKVRGALEEASASLEQERSERKLLSQAFAKQKRELEKFDRKRGAKGRFVKKDKE